MDIRKVELDYLKTIISKSKSKREVLDVFGLKGNGNSNQLLTQIIANNNINIDHFSKNKSYDFSIPTNFTIEDCSSYKEILIKLGLAKQDTVVSTRTYLKIKRAVQKNNLDISHFNDSGRFMPPYQRQNIREIFCKYSKVSHTLLKRRYNKLRNEQKCDICGIIDWMNEPIVLQLDHINGVCDDNRIENLRLICPNCHSQTMTFGGRNNRKNMRL